MESGAVDSGKSKRKRYEFIEGMRGAAALYVVFQHCCTIIDPNFLYLRANASPRWLAEIFRFFINGHFAVAAFIVLSGFCLKLSLYSRGDGTIKDTKQFFVRRCRRILPPYYACLALSLVVCKMVTEKQTGQPFQTYLPVTWENTMAHVLMIHNLSRDWMYKINGVLWSISIEFQLYLVFPLILVLLDRQGTIRVVLGSIISTLAIIFLFPTTEKLYVWYAGLFVVGMAAARAAFDPKATKPPMPLLVWSTAGFLALALISTNITKELYWRDLLMGVAVAGGLILGCQRPESLPARAFGIRPLVWLGAMSYSLYLMHHPILQIVYVNRPEWAATPLRQLAYLFVVAIPLIVVACYGFYWVFERPFVSSKPAKNHA